MGPNPNGPRSGSCFLELLDTQVERGLFRESCWRFLGISGFCFPPALAASKNLRLPCSPTSWFSTGDQCSQWHVSVSNSVFVSEISVKTIVFMHYMFLFIYIYTHINVYMYMDTLMMLIIISIIIGCIHAYMYIMYTNTYMFALQRHCFNVAL